MLARPAVEEVKQEEQEAQTAASIAKQAEEAAATEALKTTPEEVWVLGRAELEGSTIRTS